MKYDISINQKKYEIEIGAISNGTAQVTVNSFPYQVQVEKQADRHIPAPAVPPPARIPAPVAVFASGTITAPIPGLIVDIPVSVGDMVKAGQVVVVIEAMKMENPLITTIDGQVKEIRLQKGAQVATGAVILLVG
jgi:biotin carboxyl carrier protein